MKKESEYLAHISKDGTRFQTVLDHSLGVAELAKEFSRKFDHEDWGYCEGLFHDIGKYSEEFQKRIRGENIRVDHSTAGAKLLGELGGYYSLLTYCTAGHHTGIPDYNESKYTALAATLKERFQKSIPEYSKYRDDIAIPELSEPRLHINEKCPAFSVMFFIRMLYSCLVDADFLDTEHFMSESMVNRDSGESIPYLMSKFYKYVESWLLNDNLSSINGHRSQILRTSLEKGKLQQGFFKMTVPTGGGKTVASLGFALQHAKTHHLDRVIYGIPYTSIIEQNAKIFREILGDENILENHSNVNYDDCDDNEEELKKLASENFDKRVVVTTNVQFFESMFASKSSRCRKLHNYANSVIILDEAQSIPTEYLIPCLYALKELVDNYHSTVVFCTATQPALDEILKGDFKATELCPDVQGQFDFFKRNKMSSLGEVSEEELKAILLEENQALCILNNRKRVKSLYDGIRGEGVYALSTLMIPEHRKRVLSEIKQRLSDRKKCILISTCLVEAGVDLDFQNVYRENAGIDSIIQAAGRGNREGKRNPDQCNVFVFASENSKSIPPSLKQPIALSTAVQREYQADFSSLEAINKYFSKLYYHKGNQLDQKNIIASLNETNGAEIQFRTIDEIFEFIPDQTKTVLIPWDDKAKECIQRLRYGERTRDLMRLAGRYSVNLFSSAYQNMLESGIIEPLDAEISVLADMHQYSEETGLSLDINLGDAFFF